MDALTLVHSTAPANVGKVFDIDASGGLIKTAVASITAGTAYTVGVPNAVAMMKLLQECTASPSTIIVNGVFRGAEDGRPLSIVTAAEFKRLVAADGGDPKAAIDAASVWTNARGERFAPRLKTFVRPSSWLLLDADEPEGFPEAWRVPFAERLRMIEEVMPGVLQAARVELRSATGRIAGGGPSHAWVQVADAEDVERAGKSLVVAAVAAGLFFMTPIRSRADGSIIGSAPRTLLDAATWVPGRLNFDSLPTVTAEAEAAGFKVGPAAITLAGTAGAVLDTSRIETPSTDDFGVFRERTNMRVHVEGRGADFVLVDETSLKDDTLIERRGLVKPFSAWVYEMDVGGIDHLRCETPFRVSSSEAAYIGREAGGPFLFDSGSGIKYRIGLEGFSEETSGEEQASGAEEDADLNLLASAVPIMPPAAFYGPLRRIVETATATSEATRVGVASHVLAMFSAIALRPFMVSLGDETAGLNLFLIQLGSSSKGRKGTSEAWGNKYLMPGLRDRAAAWTAEREDRRGAAADAKAQLRAAETALAEVFSRRERVEALTEAEVAEAEAALDAEALELDVMQSRADGWREEMAGEMAGRSPDWFASRSKAVDDLHNKILSRRAKLQIERSRVEALRADLESAADILTSFDADVAAARAAVAEVEAMVTASAMSAGEEAPWCDLLSKLAEPLQVMRGVSTGQGIINRVRDDAEVRVPGELEPSFVPGVADKRLLINLPEFGSVLQGVRKPNSQLSEVWRQAFDCAALATGAKTDPCKCDEPFICVSASVTPAELRGLLFDARDVAAQIDNGFANRHLYLYVARAKLVALPSPAVGYEELVEEMWQNLLQVYSRLQPEKDHLGCLITLSPEAAAMWEPEYRRREGLRHASVTVEKLTARTAVYVRKMAAVLAILNGEHEVSAGALQAALHWVDYSTAAAAAFLASGEDRRKAGREERDRAEVLAALIKLEADREPVKRSTVAQVVKDKGINSKRLEEIVSALAVASPPFVIIGKEFAKMNNGHLRGMPMLSLTDYGASHIPPRSAD